MNKKTRSRISFTIKILITAAVCYFVYIKFRENFIAFSEMDKEVNWGIFAISILLIIITFIFTALAWKTILKGMGYDLGLPRTFKIMFLSNLGKYVPGKIWQAMGVIYLSEKSNIPKSVSAASFIFTQLYIIPAALLISAIYLIYSADLYGGNTKTYGMILLLLSAAALLLLIFKPIVIQRIVNLILRRIRIMEIEFEFNKIRALKIELIYFLVWIILGAGFVFFTRSMISLSQNGYVQPEKIIHLMAIYVAAYIAGYLSILTPGGIGVREGALLFLLSPLLSPGEAALISVGSRFWFILGEIICSIISLAIK